MKHLFGVPLTMNNLLPLSFSVLLHAMFGSKMGLPQSCTLNISAEVEMTQDKTFRQCCQLPSKN